MIHKRLHAPHGPADLLVAGLAASLVAYVVYATFAPGGPAQVAADAAALPFGAAATAFACRAARSQRRTRGPRIAWRLLAAAFAAWWVGDILWFVYDNVFHEAPTPSLADVAYLAMYPLLLGGLIALPSRGWSATRRIQAWLDVATVMVGGGLVIWYAMLRPITLDGDPLGVAVTAAYPVGDLVLLFSITRLSLRPVHGIGRLSIASLIVGLCLMLLADLTFAYLELAGRYVSGGIADQIFLAAWLAFAVAGRSAGRGEAELVDLERGTPRAVAILPLGAVVVSYGLLLGLGWNRIPEPLIEILLACVVLTALVLVRQMSALRENMRLSALRAIEANEARFRSLVQHSSDLIIVVGLDGIIRFHTPSVRQLLGYPSSLVGVRLLDIVHADDAPRADALIRGVVETSGLTGAVEWRLHAADDAWVYVETVGANLLDDPNVGGVVLNSRDIRERKALEEKLAHQAYHDPLTGLANRSFFHDRVESALARARHAGSPMAVLFLDLDNFKTVNDSLGHSAGDHVLTEAAARLRACISAADTPARLGGDEFAILVEARSLAGTAETPPVEGAAAVARAICESFSHPFEVEGKQVMVTSSVGIAVSESAKESAAELLRDADVAMYAAKERGRSRWEVFEPGMHTAVLRRLEMEAELRRAIERKEFVLQYQPIVRLDGGRIVGFEALIRWRRPDGSIMPPVEFIPLAEETGLILPIGAWALGEACHQLRDWQQFQPGKPLTLAVNLSACQLQRPEIVDEIAQAIDEAGISPEVLTVEITETVLMEDMGAVVDRLRLLRAIGVRAAIDDFGIGYSSLSYLRTFPVDVIKIDKSFVDGVVATDGQQAAIVRGIVGLARAMGMETVAEGIETEAQREVLIELGCEQGQGFLLSQPVYPDEATELLVAGTLPRAEATGESGEATKAA